MGVGGTVGEGKEVIVAAGGGVEVGGRVGVGEDAKVPQEVKKERRKRERVRWEIPCSSRRPRRRCLL